MRFSHRFQQAAVLLSLVAASCSDPADVSVDPLTEVVVTATDFSFQAPLSVPAGLTRFRLLNQGSEHHHLQLVRLADGHTLAELLERIAQGEFSPPWATFVGGPGVPPQGGASEVTLNLTAGEYAMLCLIPSPDGVPHLMKGMVRPLTVTPSENTNPGEPNADVQMVLDDYSFTFTPEIRSGRRTIRVENAAAQPHEVVFLRAAPGKTAVEVLEYLEHQDGPPPFEVAGGTVGLSRGEVNFVTADFAPGDYLLLCFIPDAADGRPHVAHGMVRQLRVE